MSDLEVIQSALERAGNRRRWGRGLRGLWHGLLWGAIISFAMLLLYRLLPVPDWFLIAAALVSLPFMATGLIWGLWEKPSQLETARWLDNRTHLKERLSTALELSKTSNEPWQHLVVSDAASHARDLDASRLLPFHLPRVTRYAIVILALTAGLGFVPEYRSKAYLEKQADKQSIKQAGQQLVQISKRELEKRSPALETTQKAVESVNELGEKLSKAELTRSEALRDLASVTEKLQQQLKEMGKEGALKALEQAARANGGGDNQNPNQQQTDGTPGQNGKAPADPEKIEKLKQDLERMREAAKSMNNTAGSEGAADRQKLSDSLASLSRQAEEMGLQLPDLDQAIQALAANDTELFLKETQATLKDLEKLADMARALKQMQQQAQKLGKDLAEQLENGQPDLARATLQKMIQQLQDANLSTEQMNALLQEVSKAIDPAGNYGKVAEHLKSSTRSLQAGNKAGAAEGLAAAAKELEDLMKDMADAEMLMSQLDALQQASTCIGTGKCWGAARRPGVKPGGKPGSGVGTWGNDEEQWDGQPTEQWDNSSLTRPDMDPKGFTEREQSDLGDVLKPTKVKGQFSPGGQMPSITLKGVSIKGSSQVEYREAAAAAQSEAENALSQEKVPKAYQGAVRDYFDDLKK